jgi:hypothetical protein
MGRTQPWEFIITWRLPWRRRMYDISMDQYMIGYPRVALRLRWGGSCDQYMPRQLIRSGLPESFERL